MGLSLSRPRIFVALLVIVGIWATTGCRRPPPPRSLADPAGATSRAPVESGDLLQARELGTFTELPPWIGHLKVIDLDQDGRDDIVFCESQENEVRWIRQISPGQFAPEALLAKDMSGPVHVEAADMDGDRDLDLLVSSMTIIFPHNDRIGIGFVLENDGAQNFTPHRLIEDTSRIVDMRAADLNGDGRLDLVLAQFGYDQGEVCWLEHVGPTPWDFERHVLWELSGTINIEVADFNGDRIPDIAALVSQQWEEVYLFAGQGGGSFTTRRIWGSTNEDYGSSGLVVGDLNRDGRPDLIYTNGDGFGPAATPGPRPWHGVQWLENTGQGNFAYHRIGSLPGAYAPMPVDLDQDGFMDIVTAAAYADWNNQNREVVSLMWWRNDGHQNFGPHILTREPKDLITLGIGRFDRSGYPAIVTGGFYIYPPFDAMGRILLWQRAAYP